MTDEERDQAAKEAEDAQAKADKAAYDAAQAQAAIDAKKNPDGSDKTDEQLEADRLAQEADDARAVANEKSAATVVHAHTVSEANVNVSTGMSPDMDLGEHRAQKFGNDPANPKPAPGVDNSQEARTVRMTRKTPDLPEGTLAEIWVAPEMKGDYARAGWNEA